MHVHVHRCIYMQSTLCSPYTVCTPPPPHHHTLSICINDTDRYKYAALPNHSVPAYNADMGTTALKNVRMLMFAAGTRPLATSTKASMLQNAMCHLWGM